MDKEAADKKCSLAELILR